MTASRVGAAVDALGKRLHAAFLSGRPTGSLRRTPQPRLLHHAPGRQQALSRAPSPLRNFGAWPRRASVVEIGAPGRPRLAPLASSIRLAGMAGPGEVAEWSIAPHSKCGMPSRASGVRIPPSPPVNLLILLIKTCFESEFELRPQCPRVSVGVPFNQGHRDRRGAGSVALRRQKSPIGFRVVPQIGASRWNDRGPLPQTRASSVPRRFISGSTLAIT